MWRPWVGCSTDSIPSYTWIIRNAIGKFHPHFSLTRRQIMQYFDKNMPKNNNKSVDYCIPHSKSNCQTWVGVLCRSDNTWSIRYWFLASYINIFGAENANGQQSQRYINNLLITHWLPQINDFDGLETIWTMWMEFLQSIKKNLTISTASNYPCIIHTLK